MYAPALTEALAQINDKLAAAARDDSEVIFFCECGDCLAENVRLSLDEFDRIRAREDIVFAPGHDVQRADPGKDLSTGSRQALKPRPPRPWRGPLLHGIMAKVPSSWDETRG